MNNIDFNTKYTCIIGERRRAHPYLLNYPNFRYIYLLINIFIGYIYFRLYVMHVPLMCNAQTSDQPVEVQWSIIIITLKTATLVLSCSYRSALPMRQLIC